MLWIQSLPIWTKCQRRRQLCLPFPATCFSPWFSLTFFPPPCDVFRGSSSSPKTSSMVITLNCMRLARPLLRAAVMYPQIYLTSELYLSQWDPEDIVVGQATEDHLPLLCPKPPHPTHWMEDWVTCSFKHREGNLVVRHHRWI